MATQCSPPSPLSKFSDLLALLDEDDRKVILFLFRECIKEMSPSNEIQTVEELFTMMNESWNIGKEPSVLAEVFFIIQRIDLLRKLGFEEDAISVGLKFSDQTSSACNLNRFRVMLLDIIDKLSSKEIEEMKKHLPHGRSTPPSSNDQVDFFIFLEDSQLLSEGNVQTLMKILRSIKRFDLVLIICQHAKIYDMKFFEDERTSAHFMEAEPPTNFYHMKNGVIGHCVVIYIENAICGETGQQFRRKGAADDLEKIRHVFDNFGFNVEVYRNQTNEQILKIAERYAKSDHSNFDAFVMLLVGHGMQGTILSSDAKNIYHRDVVHMFKADVCPSLQGKPKLFFIDTCQTKNENGAWEAPPECKLEEHFLISCAAVPGEKSYSGSGGSWFIHSLCCNLHKYGENMDLVSILERVTGHITDCNVQCQTPYFASILTKKVQFKMRQTKQPALGAVGENSMDES